MIEKIDSFSGVYRFLSNFWPSPMIISGKEYPTVEHFYQSMKCSDDECREKIRNSETPAIAKYSGRCVLYINPIFEENKVRVMEIGVRQKFLQNKELAEMLLKTGDIYLEEGNTWGDQFWGVCKGKGKNMLGHILMKIRKEIQQ